MITERQEIIRRKRLGASDFAALVGKDPWKNAADVYLSKTTKSDRTPTPAMLHGTRMEPAVLAMISDEIGPLTRRGTHRRLPGTPIMANLDALHIGTGYNVEAKTAGLTGWRNSHANDWGDEHTDQIPQHYLIQVTIQMHLAKCPWTYVGALIAGRGLTMFTVPYDRDMGHWLIEVGKAFWRDHVLAGIPPDNVAPSSDTIRAVRRQPGKSVEAGPVALELYERRAVLKEVADAAAKEYEQADGQYKLQFGDANEMVFPDGGVVEFVDSVRRVVDTEKLKRDGLWEQYCKESVARTMRDRRRK